VDVDAFSLLSAGDGIGLTQRRHFIEHFSFLLLEVFNLQVSVVIVLKS